MKTQPYWMLVHRGLMQYWVVERNGKPDKVWPMAKTREDAARLGEFLKAGPDVRPALIGSVKGETMEGLVELALGAGCSAACCVDGWSADGSPVLGWIRFDQ